MTDQVRTKRLARVAVLLWSAVAMCAGGLTAGCTAVAPPAPEEGVTDVFMQNIEFVSKEVTIKVGETVRWTNLERAPIPHTTTSGDPSDDDPGVLWDSGILTPGQSFRHTFNEAGEFEYYCIPHFREAAMRHAKVIVEP